MPDQIQSRLDGQTPEPPIGRPDRLRYCLDRGRPVIELEAGPQHGNTRPLHGYANPMGTLHGGVLCDIADAAMGLACASLLGDGESFTTLELKINFLRPVWTGRLRAVGRVCTPAARLA